MGNGQAANCPKCSRAVAPNMRRCPGCGAWMRPWSTGGSPSRWARYDVGGAGRPEEWGGRVGQPTEAAGAAWQPYGKRMDRVRMINATGQETRSGAHQPIRGGAKPPKQRRRGK